LKRILDQSRPQLYDLHYAAHETERGYRIHRETGRHSEDSLRDIVRGRDWLFLMRRLFSRFTFYGVVESQMGCLLLDGGDVVLTPPSFEHSCARLLSR
jgi:hypothetical protein